MRTLSAAVSALLLTLTLALCAQAGQNPDEPVSIVGQSAAGNFAVTYTNDENRIAEAREFLRQAKLYQGDGIEGLVTADSPDNPDLQKALPDIKSLGPDRAPYFMLSPEGGAVPKIGTKKAGIIFATFQSAIGWFWWIHFANGPMRPVVISAIFNTIENYFFTMNPTLWARTTDKGGTALIDHLVKSKYRGSDGLKVASQILMSTIGNILTGGVFKGILDPSIFLHNPGGFALTSVAYGLVATFVINTYDAAVSRWKRKWRQTGDPALSDREVDVLMMARNVVISALFPLLYQYTPQFGVAMPMTGKISWVVAAGVGSFAVYLLAKGDSFFRWLKSQPSYARAADFASTVYAKWRKHPLLTGGCNGPMSF